MASERGASAADQRDRREARRATSECAAPAGGPRAEVERRLEARVAELERATRAHRRIATARLAAFALAVAVAWLALDRRAVSPLWIAAPLAGFAALVLEHGSVAGRRTRAERAVAFYERGLARLDDRWAGGGEPGLRFGSPHHPYADDLDLFGSGSLFERLSTARTATGERVLASWLLAPAPPAAIRARQDAVRELAPGLDLREDLWCIGSAVRGELDPERVVAWAEAPATLAGARIPSLAAACSLLTLAAGATSALTSIGIAPFLAAAALQASLELAVRARVSGALAGIDRAARDLDVLSSLLARFEAEPLEAPRAAELRRATAGDGAAGSTQIRRLERRVHLLDSARNLLFAPIAVLFSWRLQLACAIDRWRVQNGPSVSTWLEALGELEALCALGAFAFERPDASFPEIAGSGPLFSAQGIGHPLLPAASCVRNDVHLDAAARCLIVSGSNMSGKSTLLRAVGANAVLAFAGAPVCAHRLELSALALGAAIRINDSLQDGSSRFHAEVTRIADLLRIAGDSPPLLFLLDEILHGTNSHDRRIGAEAIVRRLLERGAIGLVTTHDLALAAIADAAAGGAIANVHFVDRVEDGRMVFDYRMHPGVVRRSNALDVMRALGIDV